MGSPLGQTLENVFFMSFRRTMDVDCPIGYKPYRRYVEDTFLLSSSALHVTKVLNYINFKNRM